MKGDKVIFHNKIFAKRFILTQNKFANTKISE